MPAHWATRSSRILEDPQDDNIVWMQTLEPAGLLCLDEIDGATLRNCQQINELLLGYKFNSADVEPALATAYSVNDDLTERTFKLREGVVFHDGSHSTPTMSCCHTLLRGMLPAQFIRDALELSATLKLSSAVY